MLRMMAVSGAPQVFPFFSPHKTSGASTSLRGVDHAFCPAHGGLKKNCNSSRLMGNPAGSPSIVTPMAGRGTARRWKRSDFRYTRCSYCILLQRSKVLPECGIGFCDAFASDTVTRPSQPQAAIAALMAMRWSPQASAVPPERRSRPKNNQTVRQFMYASAKHGKERCRRLQTVGFFQPQPRCIFNLRFPAAKRGKTRRQLG